MDASRFDRISKRLALRRRALHTQTEHATPEAAPDQPSRTPELLFVQTFQAGAITPKEGVEGRYTLALEAGTGQTVYFSDRPGRRVGATPTDRFFDRLGFPDDNPPNAALVVETAPGETDIAVVELFSPAYDETTGRVTYDVEVLENWQAELGVGLHEAPTDLATLEPSFGAAHLFIDGLKDCPDGNIECRDNLMILAGTIPGYLFDNFCSRTITRPGAPESITHCYPCSTPRELVSPYQGDPELVWQYWSQRCNDMFPERNDTTVGCEGGCHAFGWCEPDPLAQKLCPAYP